MLREISNSQDDIREQTNIEANTLKTRSNDDYYLVKNSNQLQKVLDEILSSKALAFTQKVNQILNETIRTSYSYLATNLDDEYD